EPVEQLVEQIVHVPKILQQKRIQHRSVEMITDVPVPQIVEDDDRPGADGCPTCPSSSCRGLSSTWMSTSPWSGRRSSRCPRSSLRRG
ncbi:unnamed protein product, partial [Prorocentrum cordatum]